MEKITLVQPHRVVSRKINREDTDHVLEQSKLMRDWMLEHRSCVGLAHSQFESADPLAFFITESELIVNPEITWRSPGTLKSKEGCMTYPEREHLDHDRHVAIRVKYQILKDGKLVEREKHVQGFDAKVYQHEIDHINGKYCYDDTGKD